MTAQTIERRYVLMVVKDSSDVWGWNGYVRDNVANKNYHLHKVVVDYFLDGETGYAVCAFDTRAELVAAARKKAKKLAAINGR